MLHRRHLLGLTAALALSACATGPRVDTDFDPAADFSGFRTYTWAYDRVQPGVSQLTWQRTRDAIDRTLQARGFRQGEPAQFAVGFTLGMRERIHVQDLGPYYGANFGRGWNGGWGGAAGWSAPRRTQVRTVTEGTLVIDVFDVATQTPVWHGIATQTIGSAADQPTIDRAVEAVLAGFPPTPTR